MRDDEIATQVGGLSLERAASALVDLANARGGEDNVTVILYGEVRPALLRSAGRAVVNLTLVLLVALVVAGAIGAVLLASGALPTPP